MSDCRRSILGRLTEDRVLVVSADDRLVPKNSRDETADQSGEGILNSVSRCFAIAIQVTYKLVHPVAVSTSLAHRKDAISPASPEVRQGRRGRNDTTEDLVGVRRAARHAEILRTENITRRKGLNKAVS